MAQEQKEKLNILTFDYRTGPHIRVSPIIDGTNILEEWDLGARFVPLQEYELTDPILALDNIYLQCETISLNGFCLGSCFCGYTGCGAVLCDVTLEYGEMVWENFGTNKPSSLPHIGPFKFDWDQVIGDLKKTQKAHRNTLA